jgi:hypothetical protein
MMTDFATWYRNLFTDKRDVLVEDKYPSSDYQARRVLDIILSNEYDPAPSPILRRVVVENYQPGLFSLSEWRNNEPYVKAGEPYIPWLSRTLADEISRLAVEDNRHFSPADEELLIRNAAFILDLSYNGKRFDSSIPVHYYQDVFQRILNLNINGDLAREYNYYSAANAVGKEVALPLLQQVEKERWTPARLIKLGVLLGLVGVDYKLKATVGSGLSDKNIIPLKTEESLTKRLARVTALLLDKVERSEYAIDHLSEYCSDVVWTQKKTCLFFFSDDYMESLCDLKRLEMMLVQNRYLDIVMVPRNGRYANDFSLADFFDVLQLSIFERLAGLYDSGRFRVSRHGPRTACVDGRFLAEPLVNEILEAQTQYAAVYCEFKGARTFDMMAGQLAIPSYFSFVVCAEFSESVTGVNANLGAPIIVKQPPNESVFSGFKRRHLRKVRFEDGREAFLAAYTTREYSARKCQMVTLGS